MRIGIGIGIPRTRHVSGGAFSPTNIAGNVLWLDSTMGITLGGTLRAAGTTPPVVTITGTLTQATAILLDVPVGGARGTAQFRWSFDNGSTWSAQTLTAATVAIGSTGVTANFPIGTYNTDNTYKTTVATWTDQGPSGNTVTQATAGNQPIYIYSSSFGGPVVAVDNAALRLARATGGLTGDSAHSMWIRVRPTATSGSNNGFCALGSTSTVLLHSQIGSSVNVLNYGTSTTTTPSGSTVVNGTVYSIGKTHVSGGGADQGYLAGATDGGTVSRTYNLNAGLVIGTRVDTGGLSPSHEMRKVLMYSAVPSALEIANITTWLAL